MAIDFRARDFAHPILIWKLHRFLERSQWLSPSEFEEEQARLLQGTIRHAYEFVPYYTRLFDEAGIRPESIRTASDLASLPLLTREILHREGDSFHAPADRFPGLPYSTSGTSGRPLRFLLDARANSLEFAYYWRHWSWAGYRLGDPFAEIGANHFLRRPALSDAVTSWQPHTRRLMLNSSRISVSQVREMALQMRRRKTRFIKGMASTLFFFARCLEEAGEEGFSLTAAFSTGEALTPGFRAGISSVLGCPVLDSYGHMERTVGISQCLDGGYHVNGDYGLLELHDPQTTPDGTTRVARAVGTSLYNRAMPLIRYDVGDSIELFDETKKCPCGRQLPLVKRIWGRNEDVIVTPEGEYVTGIFILPEFVKGVGLAQFEQFSSDEMEIRIVPAAGWNDRERDALLDRARHMLGSSMRIRIRVVSDSEITTDASGKRRVVISFQR